MPSDKLSFTEAAIRVLEHYGDRKPMHYRAITDKALENGWLTTEGQTPWATMYAQILMELKRYRKRGDHPRFVQHGKGYVGLTKWIGAGLSYEIEQHNRRIREKLLTKLQAMQWQDFEDLIGRLLAELGFEDIEVTKRHGDGGIDVRGTLVIGDVIRTRMAVQAKCWKAKRNVQSTVVQQVRGSLGAHEQGLIITTSDFSDGAKKEAARPDAIPVALMNGKQLVELLAGNDILTTRQQHDILDLEEEGE